MMNLFGTLTLNNCTLLNNKAVGGNGGTAGVANPPTGSGQGGGIVNLSGGRSSPTIARSAATWPSGGTPPPVLEVSATAAAWRTRVPA